MCLDAAAIASSTSLEVVATVLEMTGGLNLPVKAEGSCGLNDGAVNKPFIGSIVNLGEGVVVAAGDGEGGGQADSAETEEVRHVHKGDCVEGRSGQVEMSVTQGYGRVHAVVLYLPRLLIEHQICHGIILVAHEVLINEQRALVEGATLVCSVTLKFMSINEPVDEREDCVFVRDPRLSRRVNVEGHVLVTLDVHEVVVEAQEGGRKRLLCEVSHERGPIHLDLVSC